MGDNGKPSEPPDPATAALEAGEDYYYDGPYLVFTEHYHLKRGTCCDSGCRHCPYRSAATEDHPPRGSAS